MATPSAAEKKKKEQERIKMQLAVLGAMLLLVVWSNRAKFMGGGGTQTGTATARAAGTANTAGALAPGALAVSGGGGVAAPAQTPDDIPVLTAEVVQKLHARAQGRPMEPDEVDPATFKSTINPFTSFSTDAEIASEAEEASRPVVSEQPKEKRPTGPRIAEIPHSLLGYRAYGVMILDGEKQAIIKKDGRVVPYHLREGEHFEPPDDNFKVQITGDNRVWIEDTEAGRSDERLFELSSAAPRAVQGGSLPSAPATTGTRPGGAEKSEIYLDENF